MYAHSRQCGAEYAELIADSDRQTEFFVNLAGQGLAWRFTPFYLATGKFPLAAGSPTR